MMLTKNFEIRELVPEVVYNYYEENSIWFIDMRMVNLSQFFRDYFNVPVTINNWHIGGKFQESGFRMPNSKAGAGMSQHKFKHANDLKFQGIADYEAIRKIVIDNWPLFKEAGLTCIEADTPSWLHADIRFTNISDLLIVPYR